MTAATVRMRKLTLGAVPIVGLGVLWVLAIRQGWADPRLLPSPLSVLRAPADPFVSFLLVRGVKASLLRYAQGVAIGSSLGLLAGLWLGLSPRAWRMVGPTFNGLRQVAIFAWIPLLTAWLGVGEPAKIAFIALAAFKPMTLATQQGVSGVSGAYLETGRALRLGRWPTIVKIMLPAAAPALLTGLQLAFLSGWLATLGVETLVGFGEGLGAMLLAGREHFRMDMVVLGILVTGVIGLVFNLALRCCFNRLFPWRTAAG